MLTFNIFVLCLSDYSAVVNPNFLHANFPQLLTQHLWSLLSITFNFPWISPLQLPHPKLALWEALPSKSHAGWKLEVPASHLQFLLGRERGNCSGPRAEGVDSFSWQELWSSWGLLGRCLTQLKPSDRFSDRKATSGTNNYARSFYRQIEW